MRRTPLSTSLRTAILAVGLIAFTSISTGCALFGAGAHMLVGDEKEVDIDAKYRDLVGKRVAVLVASDSYSHYNHREVEKQITEAMSSYLRQNVEGAQLMAPDDVARFKAATPTWPTLSNGEIMQRMHVDRLVYVNVMTYSTHEPGNSHVWQGYITAGVGVAEVEQGDGSLAFMETISARYPSGTAVGVIDSDERTIAGGTIREFASRATRLFYDHSMMVKR